MVASRCESKEMLKFKEKGTNIMEEMMIICKMFVPIFRLNIDLTLTYVGLVLAKR